MTKISRIVDGYSVSPQLSEDDFSHIEESGFKTVINFRPDREKSGYLDADEATEIAAKHNIAYFHVPVSMKGITQENIIELQKILAKAEKPILGHCGTGKRAAIVWAFASATDGNVDDIIGCCAGAGHDIAQLRPHLEGMKS